MRNRRAAFTAFNTDLQVLHQWDCSKAQESRELPGIGADLEPGTAERLTVAMSWFGCSLVNVSTEKSASSSAISGGWGRQWFKRHKQMSQTPPKWC